MKTEGQMEQLKKWLKLLEELEQLERIAELKSEQLVFFCREGIVSLTGDFAHLREFFPEEMTIQECKDLCKSYGIDDCFIINKRLAKGCEPLSEA